MGRVTIAVLLLAVAGAAEAQTDKAARCAELGALYDRYSGRRGEGSGGPSLDRAGAAMDCQNGKYDQGIKTLENLLRRSAITVPPG